VLSLLLGKSHIKGGCCGTPVAESSSHAPTPIVDQGLASEADTEDDTTRADDDHSGGAGVGGGDDTTRADDDHSGGAGGYESEVGGDDDVVAGGVDDDPPLVDLQPEPSVHRSQRIARERLAVRRSALAVSRGARQDLEGLLHVARAAGELHRVEEFAAVGAEMRVGAAEPLPPSHQATPPTPIVVPPVGSPGGWVSPPVGLPRALVFPLVVQPLPPVEAGLLPSVAVAPVAPPARLLPPVAVALPAGLVPPVAVVPPAGLLLPATGVPAAAGVSRWPVYDQPAGVGAVKSQEVFVVEFGCMGFAVQGGANAGRLFFELGRLFVVPVPAENLVCPNCFVRAPSMVKFLWYLEVGCRADVNSPMEHMWSPTIPMLFLVTEEVIKSFEGTNVTNQTPLYDLLDPMRVPVSVGQASSHKTHSIVAELAKERSMMRNRSRLTRSFFSVFNRKEEWLEDIQNRCSLTVEHMPTVLYMCFLKASDPLERASGCFRVAASIV
jgi:hypothetical protein